VAFFVWNGRQVIFARSAVRKHQRTESQDAKSVTSKIEKGMPSGVVSTWDAITNERQHGCASSVETSSKEKDSDVIGVSKKQKLCILFGGPMHGELKWLQDFPQQIEEYIFTFGDRDVGIYYWRLNQFQANAIRQQVVQLRSRYGELELE